MNLKKRGQNQFSKGFEGMKGTGGEDGEQECCWRVDGSIYNQQGNVQQYYIQMKIELLFLILLTVSQSQVCNVARCQTCETPDRCSKCMRGYDVDDAGKCGLFTPVEGCRIYSSTRNQCAECQTQRMLIDGKCLKMPDNCLQADRLQQCVQCISGYKLIRDQCLPTDIDDCALGSFPLNDYCQPIGIQHCQTTIDNYCDICLSGYLNLNGVCIPATSQRQQCTDCECAGLFYQGKCYKIQKEHCLKSTNGIYCQLCDRGFVQILGICYRPVKLDDINCNVLENGECTGCNQNFKLDRNKYCVKDFNVQDCLLSDRFDFLNGQCFYKDLQCAVINPQTYQCRACFEGYELINGQCDKIDKCSQFGENQICFECFPGFYLDPKKGICEILQNKNCLDYNPQFNRCQACSNFTQFTPTNSGQRICAFIDLNCLNYNIQGSCIQCPTITHFLVGRSCILKAQNCLSRKPQNQAKCQICGEGFHLDAEDEKCYENQQGCLYYRSGIICRQCDNQYLLREGVCYFIDEQCLQIDGNGNCLRCRNGFLPYFQRCVYYDPYCIAYNQNRQCARTFDGFSVASQSMSEQQKIDYRQFVSNAGKIGTANSNSVFSGSSFGSFNSRGIIQQLPYARVLGDLVASWSFRGEVTCKQNYQQVGDECQGNEQVIVYNCLVQTSDRRCSTCKEGFTLSEDRRCILSRNNCQEYNIYGLCSRCENEYTFWGGTCVRLNCRQFFSDYCKDCLMNYSYQYGICFTNTRQNCIYYDGGQCSSCKPGYYLSLEGLCQRTISSCLVTNQDTGRCITCNEGLTLYKESCIKETINCRDYDFNERCVACVNRTNLLTQLMSDGTCPTLPFKCKTLNERKICAECHRGFTLYPPSNPMQCVILRPNCREYGSLGRCSRCQTNYVLRFSQCFLSILNCEEVNNQTQRCDKCAQGFNLTVDGFCAIFDENCVERVRGICIRCIRWYHLDDNGFCLKNPTGCILYSFQQQKCIQCSELYLNVNGKCSLRDGIYNGCDKYFEGFPECLSCIEGFTLKNKLCYANNCLRYTIDRNCKSCPVYFRANPIDNRYCIPYFCRVYNSLISVCTQYQSFYIGGHTIKHPSIITIDYCLSYLDSGICSRCSNFRYPNSQTLYGLCYPYNCQSIKEFNCKSCKKGFGRNNQSQGVCVADFCQIFNYDGTCKKCQQPYSLTAGGRCQNQGLCLKFNRVSMKCEECKPYYQLRESSCVSINCLKESAQELGKCLVCQNGFQLYSDGTCRLKFCEIQLSFTLCRRCLTGYVRDNIAGTCKPENCQQYDEVTLKCFDCDPGLFISKDGLCQTKNCADFQGFLCRQCNENYTLTEDNICQPGNCEEVNELKECLRCISGFILNQTTGLCQNQEDFCILLNPITSFCSECIENYVLTPGKKCIKKINGCLDHSSTGCSRCDSGYIAVEGKCQVKFCQKLSLNPLICEKCRKRFSLTSKGLCEVDNCEFFSKHSWVCNSCTGRYQLINRQYCQSRNCTLFGADGQCLTCQENYQLKDGDCLLLNCLNPKQAFCSACIDGWKHDLTGFCTVRECDGTDFITGKCISCHPGRRLLNGLCIKDNCLLRQSNGYCTACQKEFYVSNNQLVCIAYFCIKWDESNGQCYECANHFELKNGLCVSLLCVSFKNDPNFSLPQCSSCSGNYYPFGQYCVPKFCPSQNYDPYVDECSSCDFGFIFKKDKCVLDNCIKFSPLDQTFSDCQKCRVGYSLQTGLCLANNCSAYTPGTIKCEECFQGFYLFQEICLTENCLNYDEFGICMECQQGFQLLENKTCIRYNCIDDSFDRCLKCKEGFRVNPSSNGFCSPINCQTPTKDFSECKDCMNGLTYDNGICKDINCADFSQWYICRSCIKGFTFNLQTGLCQIEERGFCPEGQYFDEKLKLCAKISIKFCRFSLVGQPNECIQCISGYFLWNNFCYSFFGCQVYSYLYGCYSCIPGYSLINRQCTNSDQNCLQTDGSKCIQCITNYFINFEGVCEAYPLHCLSVSQGVCELCQEKFQLRDGLCIAKYCNIYDSSTYRCTQCLKFYYLNDNYYCIANPPKCLIASSTGTCIQCVESYELQGSKCTLSAKYCAKYLAGFCSKCIEGYFLTFEKSCLELPTNCVEASQSGDCLQCMLGFELINSLCFKTVSYCSLYNEQTGGCLFCLSGYYLNSRGLCLLNPANCEQAYKTGKCKVCASDYTLTENGLCLYRRDENCADFNSNFICIACRQFYYLNNKNECGKNPQNCFSASSFGLCLECVSGYYLSSDGYCYKRELQKYCRTYDPLTNICTLCVDNYYLTLMNDCKKNPQNCISANPSGKCVQCVSGFILSQGFCYREIQYCSIYERVSGLCSICISGYSVSNGYCMKEINFDLCISIVSNSCSRCLARYHWSQIYCRPYPYLCTNVDFMGNCLSCCYGSALVKGQCIPNKNRFSNCRRYNDATNECQLCSEGYQYCIGCRICLPYDPNCISRTSSGGCLSCRKGFRNIGGICTSQPTGLQNYDSFRVSCADGYRLEGDHCYRRRNHLRLSSQLSQLSYFSHEGFASKGSTWQSMDDSQNQYVGMRAHSAQIVYGLEIEGSSEGRVTEYVIQFKNNDQSPWICWNSCLGVQVEEGKHTLELDYPIIASQLRIYPIRWSKRISIKFDCLIQSQN